MQVLYFDMAGGTYALKLETIERILAPLEALPAGCAWIDLAKVLHLEETAPAHRAVLSGGTRALQIGRPLGPARIDPAWILPLPGSMFRVDDSPFRGIIQVPQGLRAGVAAFAVSRRALLLDEERVWRLSSG